MQSLCQNAAISAADLAFDIIEVAITEGTVIIQKNRALARYHLWSESEVLE